MADPELKPQDPVITAGEYVLGVLEGEDRAHAQRQLIEDSEFSRAVAWWEAMFAALIERVRPVTPSDRVWPAIEARVLSDGDTDTATAVATPIEDYRRQDRSTGLHGWKLAAALAATAAAAVLLTLLFTGSDAGSPPDADRQPIAQATPTPAPQPTPEQTPSPEQLFAQLQSEDGEVTLASRVDPGTGALSLQIAGLTDQDTAQRSPELWVIPQGGSPISLGLVPGDGSFSRELSARERNLLTAEGAALAITVEDRAGAPHDAPTPPIIASGPLSRI